MDEPQPPTDAEPSASVPPRRFRFSLGSLMVFILTAAAASALYAKIIELLNGTANPISAYDVANVVLIALLLSSTIVVCIRRETVNQGMFQVTLSCVVILATLALIEENLVRLLLYWAQLCFAVLLVLPLVLRRLALDGEETESRRAWLVWVAEVLLGSFANIILVLLGILIQCSPFLIEILLELLS